MSAAHLERMNRMFPWWIGTYLCAMVAMVVWLWVSGDAELVFKCLATVSSMHVTVGMAALIPAWRLD